MSGRIFFFFLLSFPSYPFYTSCYPVVNRVSPVFAKHHTSLTVGGGSIASVLFPFFSFSLSSLSFISYPLSVSIYACILLYTTLKRESVVLCFLLSLLFLFLFLLIWNWFCAIHAVCLPWDRIARFFFSFSPPFFPSVCWGGKRKSFVLWYKRERISFFFFFFFFSSCHPFLLSS